MFRKILSTTTALMLFASSTVMGADLNGAGATFPAPVYMKWAEQWQKTSNIGVNYQAVGSGAGQNQIFNRTIDFGASDAPVESAKLVDHKLLQVPTVMGAVVMIVNIPGLQANQLKLDKHAISEIYKGKIRHWNDPAIVAMNPELKLPHLAIAPVYRADGSGTTFVFTSYLSKNNSDWQQEVGSGTSVRWPSGNGGKGNDGVSAVVKQVPGSIGYVESVYATKNNLVTTQLKNPDNEWVSPTANNFAAAATHADWKNSRDFSVDLIDMPGKNSWPIVSATFLLIPLDADSEKTKNIVNWIMWDYKNGDAVAQELAYVPLPSEVKADVVEKLKALTKVH
jgi:phosphate transport system substrate-binding protein